MANRAVACWALCLALMALSARVAIAGDATLALLQWGKPGCKVRVCACVSADGGQMAAFVCAILTEHELERGPKTCRASLAEAFSPVLAAQSLGAALEKTHPARWPSCQRHNNLRPPNTTA